MRTRHCLPLLLLAGCLPEPTVCTPVTWYTDADGDGLGDELRPVAACVRDDGLAAAPGDCDDSDPAVFPGAAEVWYDGIDQDCAGDTDDDADADGAAAVEAGGPDCDDTDATVFPGAVETWYDGVDQDCAGDDDDDADGDGFPADAQGGDDCDDSLAAVNPDQDEICSDGLDNDCDGDPGLECGLQGDLDLDDATALLLGEASGDEAGSSAAFVGDVDGDGVPDLMVGAVSADGVDGAGGAAALMSGADLRLGEQSLSRAVGGLLGDASDDALGNAVASPGDLDSDGYNEVAAGAYGADATRGEIPVLFGPVSDYVASADADALLRGEGVDGWAGYAIAGLSGYEDGEGALLIGAPRGAPDGSTQTGAVYVVSGPIDGVRSLGSATLRIQGTGSLSYLGYNVAGGCDLDGDGLTDLLAGAPRADGAAADTGWVIGALGPTTGELDADDVDLSVTTAVTDSWLGPVACAGDVDADGADDVLIGAYKRTSALDEQGAAWLIPGPVIGAFAVEDLTTRVEGNEADAWLGVAVAGAGDLDLDGYADVAIGAPGSVGSEVQPTTYLFYGPMSGALDPADAAARFGDGSASVSPVRVGGVLAGGGDLNGDGYSELVIGAPSLDEVGTDSGGLYWLAGGGL